MECAGRHWLSTFGRRFSGAFRFAVPVLTFTVSPF
jgi:hypothetical protein